jgi:hypothetical protein
MRIMAKPALASAANTSEPVSRGVRLMLQW